MKRTYFVIPLGNTWTDIAIILSLRDTFELKSEAITKAERLSREYNAIFVVCAMETVVSTECKIISLA